VLRKLALVFITLFLFGVVPASAAETANKDRVLPVMTRKEEGSDIWYVLASAQDPHSTQLDLLVAITKTYFEMHASNIPQRADGIAAEIGLTKPYLVGLQEVTVLSIGPLGQPPTTGLITGCRPCSSRSQIVVCITRSHRYPEKCPDRSACI
jgi:hypothetical protein